ncbi:unnamed protein product [Calypogeia fissa]
MAALAQVAPGFCAQYVRSGVAVRASGAECSVAPSSSGWTGSRQLRQELLGARLSVNRSIVPAQSRTSGSPARCVLTAEEVSGLSVCQLRQIELSKDGLVGGRRKRSRESER